MLSDETISQHVHLGECPKLQDEEAGIYAHQRLSSEMRLGKGGGGE